MRWATTLLAALPAQLLLTPPPIASVAASQPHGSTADAPGLEALIRESLGSLDTAHLGIYPDLEEEPRLEAAPGRPVTSGPHPADGTSRTRRPVSATSSAAPKGTEEVSRAAIDLRGDGRGNGLGSTGEWSSGPVGRLWSTMAAGVGVDGASGPAEVWVRVNSLADATSGRCPKQRRTPTDAERSAARKPVRRHRHTHACARARTKTNRERERRVG
eukprot:COSAG01_NODE_23627_length_808_cov_1.009873_1_plen_215_part_01